MDEWAAAGVVRSEGDSVTQIGATCGVIRYAQRAEGGEIPLGFRLFAISVHLPHILPQCLT